MNQTDMLSSPEQRLNLERLQSLYELIARLNSMYELPPLLSFIVDRLLRLTGGQCGLLLLTDDFEAHPVDVAVVRGMNLEAEDQEAILRFVSTTVITDVLEQGSPRLVTDLQTDQRYEGWASEDTLHLKKVRSVLACPLKIEQRLIGLIYIDHPQRAVFGAADLDFLDAYANQAALAIERARTHQAQLDEAQQAHRLRALNDMALALGNKFNLETILETGLQLIRETIQAELGLIDINTDPDQGYLIAQTVSQGWQDILGRKTDAGVLAGLVDVLHTRLTQGVDHWLDLEQEPALSEHPLLAQVGVNALALVPIKIGAEPDGLLLVGQIAADERRDEDLSFLTGAASVIGLALQNLAHYNQVHQQTRQLSYLNDIGSALTSSLNLERVLEIVIEGVNSLMETERTSVFLIDPQTNDLVLRYSNEGEADIRLPPPWQGIAGWVATHDQPALVNDTLKDTRHLREIAVQTGYEAQSILCVPLKIEGRVIGVVEVLNKVDRGQFTLAHQKLLLQFTRWAAIALHNAQLFDDLREAYRHLDTEQERRIMAETRAAMAAIILDMAHTMNNVLGAIRVWASDLTQGLDQDPQQPLSHFERKIRRIQDNADEAIDLISGMTDPLQQAAIAETDVQACIEAAIQSCWWPDNVHLEAQQAPDLPPVKANAKRLEAVFHNLLTNATQALAADGGLVRLRSRLTHTATTTWVEVSIIDSGPGIAPHLQDRIFNPGVSGRHGGLGIGLWLVENFIRQFGGEISFTSTPGERTEFLVRLQPITAELNLHGGGLG